MTSEASKNGFNNNEYVYVRRLISVLTNDDSDKLIVEKLKGKNLSSLLYNAKVIDNSKNMVANKRILSCVIRAIEKEKYLSRRRDQSWGQKLLSSFNCLNPVQITDEFHEPISKKSCTIHSKKLNRKNHKHHGPISKQRLNSSFRSESKTVAVKASGVCSSGFSGTGAFQSNFSVQTNLEVSNISLGQSAVIRCMFLVQKESYETVFPRNLNVHQPKYVKYMYINPDRKLNTTKSSPKTFTEKKTSSTQTFRCEDSPGKEKAALPSNIKLQDLLEAATSLISTHDQKEYVKSFLNNFEPPFDLTSGFPPYLKLPMNPIDDFVNRESIYGSNSETSVMSGRMSPRRVFEPFGGNMTQQKEDRVNDYVHEFNDSRQEAAESIISGVINESLPHDRADYSQLGACILKRLGAFPGNGFKDQKISRMNTTVPEIVLSCTEWFESDTGDLDKNPKQEGKCSDNSKKSNQTAIKPNSNSLADKNLSRESIEEVKLLEEDSSHTNVSWERQRLQNFCFFDGSVNNRKVGLLDVSESSITDIGMTSADDFAEVSHDGDHLISYRNNFFLREPLTISPSVLDQVGKKGAQKKNGGDGDGIRWCDNHVSKSPRRVIEKKPGCKEAVSDRTDHEVVRNVVMKPSHDPSPSQIETVVHEIVSATVANLSVFSDEPEDTPKEEPIVTCYVSSPDHEEPATLGAALREPAAVEVETFDGVGECHSKLTDSTTVNKSPSDKKLNTTKNRTRTTFQDRFRGKKKCKSQGKTKKTPAEVDLSRNCKVM